MACTNGRDFIFELIERYKKQPCLWQISHLDYHSKEKRNRALNNLLEYYKTKEPDASRDTVLRKLAALRGAYQKEVRKVKASLDSGAENVHVPKLWYYNHLSFLKDQDTGKKSKTSASTVDNKSCEEEKSEDSFVDDDDASPSSTLSSSFKFSTNLKRPQSKEDQVSETIGKRMEQTIVSAPSIGKIRREHDTFGEYVAEKLRSLPTSMVPFCQKMINDAIFLAEMQSLNMSSRIVTDHFDTTPQIL